MSEVTHRRISQTLPIDIGFGFAGSPSSQISCSIGAVLQNRKEDAASISLQSILELFAQNLWHGPYARVSLELGGTLGGLYLPCLLCLLLIG